MQRGYIPHQAAGAWSSSRQPQKSAIVFGNPAALTAGTMGERCRNKVQVRHAASLWLDARPIVGRDFGRPSASLERCERYHVDGAQRAN
jgi:hypothetical protein